MRILDKLLIILIFVVALIAILVNVYPSNYAGSSSSSYNLVSDNWNFNELQKINKNHVNYSFVVYGDNRNSSGKFDQLINRVNQKNTLFSIDLGDLVDVSDINEYESFINQIKQSKAPVLTVMGNHELIDDINGYKYTSIFGNSTTVSV